MMFVFIKIILTGPLADHSGIVIPAQAGISTGDDSTQIFMIVLIGYDFDRPHPAMISWLMKNGHAKGEPPKKGRPTRARHPFFSSSLHRQESQNSII